MFTGCGTALITPFKTDGSLDEAALRSIVDQQIAAGINFLVPCGTTGESPTLAHAEHLRVVEITIEQARGRVPVLAGAGGYDTSHVIRLIADLHKVGVSGILSVTPYYNKPTQEGLFQHYKAIASTGRCPSSFTACRDARLNVEPATLVRLAEINNIVGVKEASGNVAQMARYRSSARAVRGACRRRLGDAAAHCARRPGCDFGRFQPDPGGDDQAHPSRAGRRFRGCPRSCSGAGCR